MSLELQQDKQGTQTFSAAPIMYLQLQDNRVFLFLMTASGMMLQVLR